MGEKAFPPTYLSSAPACPPGVSELDSRAGGSAAACAASTLLPFKQPAVDVAVPQVFGQPPLLRLPVPVLLPLADADSVI